MNPSNTEGQWTLHDAIDHSFESMSLASIDDGIIETPSLSSSDDFDQHTELLTPEEASDDSSVVGTLGRLEDVFRFLASPSNPASDHDSTQKQSQPSTLSVRECHSNSQSKRQNHPPRRKNGYYTLIHPAADITQPIHGQTKPRTLGAFLDLIITRTTHISQHHEESSRSSPSIPQLDKGHDKALSQDQLATYDRNLGLAATSAALRQQGEIGPPTRSLLPSTLPPPWSQPPPPPPPPPPLAKDDFAARATRAVVAVDLAIEETNKGTPFQKSSGVSIEPHMSGQHRRELLDKLLVMELNLDAATPSDPSQSDNNEGVHVFVDFSNIYFGFSELLKTNRRLKKSSNMRGVKLHFASLARIMERGRDVQKRVLVGSLPHLPGSEKAGLAGYNCSWLERVWKVKLTDQRRRAAFDYESGYGTADQSQAQAIPEGFVEQGVDEILQLKMLETVCDHDPATMVVATGDAAEAEYSDGFARQIVRAMELGWKVELVAFERSLGWKYKEELSHPQWGDQFRVVFLDDYVKLLCE